MQLMKIKIKLVGWGDGLSLVRWTVAVRASPRGSRMNFPAACDCVFYNAGSCIMPQHNAIGPLGALSSHDMMILAGSILGPPRLAPPCQVSRKGTMFRNCRYLDKVEELL